MPTSNPHPGDLFPKLSADRRARLKASIRANGVREPVVVNQHDVLLDGRVRRAICAELGIDPPPMRVMATDGADGDLEVAVVLNLHRRNLSRSQRDDAVRQLRQHRWPDRKIAEALGVNRQTVAAVSAWEDPPPKKPPVSCDDESPRQTLTPQQSRHVRHQPNGVAALTDRGERSATHAEDESLVPSRTGVTIWSTTVQAISAAAPMAELTDEEVKELHLAAMSLLDGCQGALIRKIGMTAAERRIGEWLTPD